MTPTDRDRAILWARQMLKQEFVVLDTETTGLDDDAEVCSIAVIARNGTILLDSLVKPYSPIPAAASRIHGITNEMVQGAPTFTEVLIQIHPFLTDKTVLVYNRDYDQRILLQSATAENIEFTPWWRPALHGEQARWHCVMEWFAQFYGDWNDYKESYTWKKLVAAASYFNISTDGAHGALADALMTLRVVEGMAKAQLSTETSATSQGKI